MICSKPATVHITDIVNKKKRETHLCEECAREKQLLPDEPGELNIPALLHMVMGQAAHNIANAADQSLCPECGASYAHFRSQGRLGCPHDYDVFRSMLIPLLERVHHQTQHQGKVPGRAKSRYNEQKKASWQRELARAIQEERYEDAAKLRDLLRSTGGQS
jgi:protein arginine kinase activator